MEQTCHQRGCGSASCFTILCSALQSQGFTALRGFFNAPAASNVPRVLLLRAAMYTPVFSTLQKLKVRVGAVREAVNMIAQSPERSLNGSNVKVFERRWFCCLGAWLNCFCFSFYSAVLLVGACAGWWGGLHTSAPAARLNSTVTCLKLCLPISKNIKEGTGKETGEAHAWFGVVCIRYLK